MACGGDVRTSVGGVVVGEMMRLVIRYIYGCFGCKCATAKTHGGYAFGSEYRTRLKAAAISEGGEPKSKIRRIAIGASYCDWHCSGATNYVLPWKALLTDTKGRPF